MPTSFPTRARGETTGTLVAGSVQNAMCSWSRRRPYGVVVSRRRAHLPVSTAATPRRPELPPLLRRWGETKFSVDRPPSNRRAGQFPPSMRWPVRSEPHSPCFLFTAAVIL
jgi:hypothetical protein